MLTQPIEKVEVSLENRSYDILIGDDLIKKAGEEIFNRFGAVKTVIVSDETVASHHLAPLKTTLKKTGLETYDIIVKPGESSKSWSVLEEVTAKILEAKLERKDLVIALGGGVIGDLAGFAASIVRRGIDFVQIPTSLLAQVDSSVGGKTGINTPHGKNLVGAFHQPKLVLADTSVLDTLSPRHMRAGYAEIAKYGLIDEPEFFTWLENNWQDVLKGGPARQYAVAKSCHIKAGVVARDEKESGERALLNLGHTFGHAFEGATGYSDRLIHGEAIAIGMVMAHRFSNRLNHAPLEDAHRVKAHFQALGLPTEINEINGEKLEVKQLMELISQDKKVSRGTLTFILTKGIGRSFIAHDVPPSEVEAFLMEELKRPC